MLGTALWSVVSTRSASLSLPTFATVLFGSFSPPVPLGVGRFTHLVVFCGYQGADTDRAKLSLTEQLFDAVYGELASVARRQPIVGDFNLEPTQIPSLLRGILTVLWVDLERLPGLSLWKMSQG